MIYINAIGGLGNIFFQIASIWSLAKDNGNELCLLNVDRVNANLKNLKRSELNYIFNRFPHKNTGSINVLQYPFRYTRLLHYNESEYIGFFQSEKYFKHRRSEILELFKPAEEFNIKINKYKDLFNNISLHVRRGDYAISNTNAILPIEYYTKALSLLPNNIPVLIFSDDLKWCRENFIGDRYVFIEEIDYISLYIMSKMKYHIIANSSFSWWGAWMSEHIDKIIIAPKLWFKENTEYSGDIVPENWIKI